MSWSDVYFLEVSAHVALRVATKDYFRDKQTNENLAFQVVFLKKKRRSATKKSFLDKFEMLIPGSDTYFLEVSAHVSLKVASDKSFRDKKNYESLGF